MRLQAGQVWRADLDPTESHEQSGIRPVVIISTSFHLRLTAERLAVVVPLTGRERPSWEQRIPVMSGPRPSWALTEQAKTVATTRFLDSDPWWVLTPEELAQVVRTFRRMVVV